VAGPQAFRFDEFVRQGLGARKDPREVVVDPHARYFGAELGERTLLPADDASIAGTRFEDWLSQSGTSVPVPPRTTATAPVREGDRQIQL
jgi:hypothetical protein